MLQRVEEEKAEAVAMMPLEDSEDEISPSIKEKDRGAQEPLQQAHSMLQMVEVSIVDMEMPPLEGGRCGLRATPKGSLNAVDGRDVNC